METDETIERLRRLKIAAHENGGPESAAARVREGTTTALERIVQLLDPGTFVELDVFTGGMVAGLGKMGGREVCVWAEAPLLGRRGGMTRAAGKAAKVIDLALKTGVPIVSLHDGGVLAAGAGSLPGPYGEILFRQVMASGVVPQLGVIMGPCDGSRALSALLTDFTVMVKGTGRLLFSGGQLGAGSDGDPRQTTEGLQQPGRAPTSEFPEGSVHLEAVDETAGLDAARRLLSFLPQNNLMDPPSVPVVDPITRETRALEEILGSARNSAGASSATDTLGYDMREVIRLVFDQGSFFELMAKWGASVVMGFARLGGRAVGVVANDPRVDGGCLDMDAAGKAARFIRTCDAFNVPLVTLVDTPAVRIEEGPAQGGATARHLAKLLYAYCEANVPKLTVVLGRAFGAAYEVMGSKQARSDLCLAWPSAQIASTASAAVTLARATLPALVAAKRGLVDDVIEPAETRLRLATALEACLSKREGRPPKKHGNPPV